MEIDQEYEEYAKQLELALEREKVARLVAFTAKRKNGVDRIASEDPGEPSSEVLGPLLTSDGDELNTASKSFTEKSTDR
ncbi:hypothetical protein RUND412_006931 [Rhizina undulata]